MEARPGPTWRTTAFALLVIGAVIAPAIVDHDSYPLSTYPIYAHRREREVTFDTAVGVEPSGAIMRLSLAQIADTDDPLIASSTVRGAVVGGTASELCAEIASRIDSGLTSVQIVSERHDTVEWLRGGDSLRRRTVRATCAVRP